MVGKHNISSFKGWFRTARTCKRSYPARVVCKKNPTWFKQIGSSEGRLLIGSHIVGTQPGKWGTPSSEQSISAFVRYASKRWTQELLSSVCRLSSFLAYLSFSPSLCHPFSASSCPGQRGASWEQVTGIPHDINQLCSHSRLRNWVAH